MSYDNRTPTANSLKIGLANEPTKQVCDELTTAFAHFDQRLFGDMLPRCLITLQRRRGAYGHFCHGRFATRNGDSVTDELALNPDTFHRCSIAEIMSTLVHEQVHLWQAHFGRPGRGGYHHNVEWAKKMEHLGLMPSETGKPGGLRLGRRVSHYILPEGRFARACAELIANGTTITFIDRWAERRVLPGTELQIKQRALMQAASKTRFTCPRCRVHAWGKPDLQIDCRTCRQPMFSLHYF